LSSRLLRRRPERLYDSYAKHPPPHNDEGCCKTGRCRRRGPPRRRRLPDGESDGATSALSRALAFAAAAGLEGRVGSKIQRKLGRAHQLAGRYAEATVCYRDALDRLPADDRYRSVLLGDLALTTLGVRGTLDLLPQDAPRPGSDDAERLLTEGGAAGSGAEGESYNAIYTLGVLAYERADFVKAADRFREAARARREGPHRTRARASSSAPACARRRDGRDARRGRRLPRDGSAAALDASVKPTSTSSVTCRRPAAPRDDARTRSRRSRAAAGVAVAIAIAATTAA
jgi:tetratricopeptide (TPR) repeat protein